MARPTGRPAQRRRLHVTDRPYSCTDENLWQLIEDYVLAQILLERLDEEPEPWAEMNDS